MGSVAMLPNVTSLSGLPSWRSVGYLVNAVSLKYATRGSGVSQWYAMVSPVSNLEAQLSESLLM
jgi:hypothetical protein